MVQYFPVVNGYQSFFRDPSTRVYRDGATFEDILALYEFDVELREIMLDALLKVEAKIRSAFFVVTPLIVLLGLSIFALSLGVIGMVWLNRFFRLVVTQELQRGHYSRPLSFFHSDRVA